jgi:hypothetical protein
LEELTHLVYAQVGAPVGYGLYVGIFAVILLPQGVGIVFAVVAWRGLHHRDDGWCSARPLWAPLEIATGFSLLFLFGAGFFVGPAVIMVAGALRLRELQCRPGTVHERESVASKATSVATLPSSRGNGLGFIGHAFA